MPSAKYALSASPLMLSNGRTAIDGLPGGAAGPAAPARCGRGRTSGGCQALPRDDGRGDQHARRRGSASPARRRRPARGASLAGAAAFRHPAHRRERADRIGDVLHRLHAEVVEASRRRGS